MSTRVHVVTECVQIKLIHFLMNNNDDDDDNNNKGDVSTE